MRSSPASSLYRKLFTERRATRDGRRATRKKRAGRAEEEEARNKKALELVQKRFDDFDAAAVKLLSEDAEAILNLEKMHRDDMTQLNEAEAKAVQRQGGLPAPPEAQAPAPHQALQAAAVPVITPAQLNRDLATNALTAATRQGHLVL